MIGFAAHCGAKLRPKILMSTCTYLLSANLLWSASEGVSQLLGVAPTH